MAGEYRYGWHGANPFMLSLQKIGGRESGMSESARNGFDRKY